MSEIYVKDEVVSSSFSKPFNELRMSLIFEDSVIFEQLVQVGSIENLCEKAVVFRKVQCTPNQIFVMKGLDKSHTNDLISIVKTDNEILSENSFWSKPIDGHDETIGLSDQSSWHVKNRDISKALNDIFV